MDFLVTPPGQHTGDEEREPTSTPAIPGGVYEVEFKNMRTNVVRLLPNGSQRKKTTEVSGHLSEVVQRDKLREEATVLPRRKGGLQGDVG